VYTANSSVTAIARANEIADLFEYRIDRPVTVRKNESAMLPFLQDKIKSLQTADLLERQRAASTQGG
jgi:hypothetical protein